MKVKPLFYILSALALLIWISTGMVFMQDELSALSRLEYDSLKELIEGGIRPDGHPAFVQVFLFYWTKLFGFSELAVKTPSMLCGLGSIWLTFKMTKRLFDSYVALIVVALVALSQYYVFYFSLARPYAYGTFFVLGQIYYLVQWKDKGAKPYGWTFILFTFLSAYTHYFSLLVSGLISLWGFVWLKKSQFKVYATSLVICLLLFVPHIGITLDQLEIGGIGGDQGWLASPESDFALQFIRYMAQYHPAGIFLYCAAGVISILRLPRMNSDQGRFILLGFAVLIVPFAIGYFYSLRVNPVLQFSVLIFGSTPFMISLVSGIKFFGARTKTMIFILVMAITAYGLLVERAHPRMMENQPYDDLVSMAEDDSVRPLLMAEMNPRFIAQYDKSRELNYKYIQLANLTLQAILDRISEEPEVAMHIDRFSEVLPMLWDEFGNDYCLLQRPRYDLVLLGIEDSMDVCVNDFQGLRGPKLERPEKEEFGPAFQTRLNSVEGYPFLTLIASQTIDSVSYLDGTLVSEIWRSDSLIHWLGRDVSQYSVKTENGMKVYLSFRIQDMVDENLRDEQLEWKVYFWNRQKEKIQGDSMDIRIIPDRATRYGLFNEF
ncbi:MAG: hypothetical protein HKO93_08170 [Flavobacteriales bacterium]|nr:hypothetical protein [Flavobacteriales bacterium]